MAAEINKRDYPEERRNAMAEMMISGWGGFPLIGTKEQIVDGLATLSKIGLDGVLLSWPRYIEGMREFRDVTYPLAQAGGIAGPGVMAIGHQLSGGAQAPDPVQMLLQKGHE